MGSGRLSAAPDLQQSDLWTLLPTHPSTEDAFHVLGTLARRIAQVRGCDLPAAFGAVRVNADSDALANSIGAADCTPDLLGAAWEHMMNAGDRRKHGAHFTPRSVADQVVHLAIAEQGLTQLSGPQLVWDPAAGGGAFLLAAARRIEQVTGLARGQIVRHMYASDIDPVAVAVCDASLELWAGDRARPVTTCCDALLGLDDRWPVEFDLIVGNPPFLGQLALDTGRTEQRRDDLRRAFDVVATGYVDDALLFLHLAVTRLGPNGVVTLVLPESMLGARDAERVRHAVQTVASLRSLWIDEHQSFAAAVDVVAPVLVRSIDTGTETKVVFGNDDFVEVPTPSSSSWASLLARALRVPPVRDIDTNVRLGDLANITAGFRQHFYGIDGAVRESTSAQGADELRLVTSGAIDPLHLLWGQRTLKFARTTWKAPVLELEHVADTSVRGWFEDRCIPKILLATQSKVVEAVVDTSGTLMPSVPVISVEPHDPADIWLVAAVLCAPLASAMLANRAAGTGLSRTAIRLRASELAELPAPIDRLLWTAGAAAAFDAQEAITAGDSHAYVDGMRRLATTMDGAYGGGHDAVSRWWWERLRLPQGIESEAY